MDALQSSQPRQRKLVNVPSPKNSAMPDHGDDSIPPELTLLASSNSTLYKSPANSLYNAPYDSTCNLSSDSSTFPSSKDLLLGRGQKGGEKSDNCAPMLLSYDEIPDWHQDNDYIRHGYRAESGCVRTCFASWLYLHNETVNIFSHLIPAIVFLGAEIWLLWYFRTGYPQAKLLERFVFAFFLLTAFICLGLSATYHTLMNHSAKVSHLWLRFDFVGIVVLTLGDFVSGIYMVFYCEPTLQKVYWTMILTLSAATIFILVNPRFQGRKYRVFRVSTFVGTGLSGFVPLAHGCAIFGFSQMIKQSGMLYYIGEGLLLMLGALFYTTRMPEALKPGHFDIFGFSHQVFHVLVVMATIVQLVGIMEAYDYNYHYRTCGPGYMISVLEGSDRFF